jgi:cardiolipin hydrolase
MHHKFAIFDRTYLVTGSYNWTRSAASYNEENIVVSDDRRLVSAFSGTFEKLWEKFE